MHMDVSLSNVNVGMPLSVHDKCSVEGRSLYLLRPFDVKVRHINIYRTVIYISFSHWINRGHSMDLPFRGENFQGQTFQGINPLGVQPFG